MTPKTLTAYAMLAVALPTLALAENNAQPSQPMHRIADITFADLDADSNGGVSREEWAGFLATQMSERLGARADRLIAAGDADGDDMLNHDEIVAGMTALAEERRANHDGQRGRRHRWGHSRDHGEMRSNRHDPMMRAERIFDRADRDENGAIDAEEFTRMRERMAERFERWQERHNG